MYPYIYTENDADWLDVVAPIDYQEQNIELKNIENAVKAMTPEEQKAYSFLIGGGES